MQERTKSALRLFEKADWFSHVGVKSLDQAVWLSSWEDASINFCSQEWGDVLDGARSQFRQKRFLLCRERFESGEYNDILEEVKKATKSLVEKKIKGVLGALERFDKTLREVEKAAKTKPLVASAFSKKKLTDRFAVRVDGHILSAAMEVEYADVIPLGFFSCLAFWYLRGHLPCGWQGDGRTKAKVSDGFRYEWPDIYPPGFYDPIAKWYEKGDFGNWQGQVPRGKLIVY